MSFLPLRLTEGLRDPTSKSEHCPPCSKNAGDTWPMPRGTGMCGTDLRHSELFNVQFEELEKSLPGFSPGALEIPPYLN